MIHNEQFDDAEYVYEISPRKLFNFVRKEGMPFHKWYDWLILKFAELRSEFICLKAERMEEEEERKRLEEE